MRGVASMKNTAFGSVRPWIGRGLLIDFGPYGCRAACANVKQLLKYIRATSHSGTSPPGAFDGAVLRRDEDILPIFPPLAPTRGMQWFDIERLTEAMVAVRMDGPQRAPVRPPEPVAALVRAYLLLLHLLMDSKLGLVTPVSNELSRSQLSLTRMRLQVCASAVSLDKSVTVESLRRP
ncbi:hypothetical protein OG21DRAFT_447189 [Imleria badia]|nr:hypothetical protein OG21DRAFT_447189 [Imleria badia]